MTVVVDGWHGDTSRMYLVGDVPLKARRLVDVTWECLQRGIAAAPGRATPLAISAMRFSNLPKASGVRWCAISVAMASGGVFHDAPNVVHVGKPGKGPVLKPGMVFTIEPMINLGRPEVKLLDDGWTAVTRDRSLSAQFEQFGRHHRYGMRDLHVFASWAQPSTLRRVRPWPLTSTRAAIANGCANACSKAAATPFLITSSLNIFWDWRSRVAIPSRSPSGC